MGFVIAHEPVKKAMSRIPEVSVDEQNRRMIIIIMINREKYAP